MSWNCAAGVRLSIFAVAMVAHNVTAMDLRTPRMLPGAPFSISFDASPGMFYTVEASSNLLSWEVLRTLRAPSAEPTWSDTNSLTLPLRYYRVADLSDTIVVEGQITSPDGRGIPDHCPFCDILVSSSLDGSITYTDLEGRYILRTTAAASITNVPFTLFFSKIGFRPHSAVVMNPLLPRVEVVTLAGPSNNDFINRAVVAGSATNRGDTALADVESGEPALEPSVWYSFTAPVDGTLRFVVDTTEFLPSISLYTGQSVDALQMLNRSTISNYVEWRIEVTHDLSVYAGEQLQIRVGALEHPTRGIAGGWFEWRCAFEPDFPLVMQPPSPHAGVVTRTPMPEPNGRYKPGTVVTLRAIPATNYVFIGWTGSTNSSDPVLEIAMDASKHMVPNFQLGNGSSENAVVVTNGYPAGEGWIEKNAVLWYSWTPSRLTPLRLNFESANPLVAAAYRSVNGRLLLVAHNTWVKDRITFWASNGITYFLALSYDYGQQGDFRFTSHERVVRQADIHFIGSDLYPQSVYEHREFWGEPVTNDSFPLVQTIQSKGYRPVTATLYANGDSPLYRLYFSGSPNNDFSNRITANVPGLNVGTLDRCDLEAGEQGQGEGSIWYNYTPLQDGTLIITNTTRAAIETTVWSGSAVDALALRPGWLLNRTLLDVTTEWSVNAGQPCSIRFGGFISMLGEVRSRWRFEPGFPLRVTNAQPEAGDFIISPPAVDGRYASGASVTLQAFAQPGFRFAGWSGDVVSTDNPLTFTMDRLKLVRANFAPINDNLSDAFTLAGLPVSGQGTNIHGTAEPGEPPHGGLPAMTSTWWRWTAPVTGDVQINFDFDIAIIAAVYTGTGISNLVHLANNGVGRNVRQIRFSAEGQSTYWIAVDAFEGQGGPFSFTILPIHEARYILYTGPSEGGYAVTLPSPDGNTEFGSGSDVFLHAVALNTSQFLRWEDISSGIPVVLGNATELVVRMNADRRIVPRFAVASPRLNDDFADRLILASSYSATASNVSATSEPGEPPTAPNASGHSLWWSWTATLNAPVAFSTAGSDFPNAVAVYTGGSLGELAPVAIAGTGGNQFARQVSFVAEAGVTYHISVDGINGATGTVRLAAVENEQFTLEFLAPEDGWNFAAPFDLAVHLHALNSDLTVTQVSLSISGFPDVGSTDPVPSFVYTNLQPGVYTLEASALDAYGRAASASRTIIVHRYEFAATNPVVFERECYLPFTVIRSGPAISSSVYFDVLPGSGIDGRDFERCAGRITFAANETNCTGNISIPYDPTLDPDRDFTLVLSSGAGYAPAHTARVVLHDGHQPTLSPWIDDSFPAAASLLGAVEWIASDPAPASGSLAHSSSGSHGYAVPTLQGVPIENEFIWQEIYLDPVQTPRLVAITLNAGPFYSRTFSWGDRSLVVAPDKWVGPLPLPGQWRRLVIPSGSVGWMNLNGVAWTVVGGRAFWDRTGLQSWR